MKLYKIIMLLGVLGVSPTIYADSDSYGNKSPGVEPVSNQLYLEECGACHFAYQPGLLPERSWRKMFSSLDDHFGDNAELDSDAHDKLLNYVVSASADKSSHKRSRKIARSLSGKDIPLRITEVGYLNREHRELSKKMVEGNPEVVSLSRCAACHTRATEGLYCERYISIPGYGRWDDD